VSTVRSWADFIWRLAENFASMKMEVLIFASWALAKSILSPGEWLVVVGICLGTRAINEIQWARHNATQVSAGLQ